MAEKLYDKDILALLYHDRAGDTSLLLEEETNETDLTFVGKYIHFLFFSFFFLKLANFLG